jgi:hypothetical protein
MDVLEQYIRDECRNGLIFFENLDYSYFEYENIEEMEYDLEFLIDAFFQNHKIININDDPSKYQQDIRPNQGTFRNHLIEKYNKCLITGSKCLFELEACHIIPYAEDKHNFLVSNGLLLKSNIHKTFDKYLWTINPDTFMIEIKQNDTIDIGEITNYNGVYVDLDKNDRMLINNLQKRYKTFLKNDLENDLKN